MPCRVNLEGLPARMRMRVGERRVMGGRGGRGEVMVLVAEEGRVWAWRRRWAWRWRGVVDLKVLSILIAMLIPKYLDASPGRRVASVFIDQIGIPLSLSLDGDDFVTPENMLLAKGDFPKEKNSNFTITR